MFAIMFDIESPGLLWSFKWYASYRHNLSNKNRLTNFQWEVKIISLWIRFAGLDCRRWCGPQSFWTISPRTVIKSSLSLSPSPHHLVSVQTFNQHLMKRRYISKQSVNLTSNQALRCKDWIWIECLDRDHIMSGGPPTSKVIWCGENCC